MMPLGHGFTIGCTPDHWRNPRVGAKGFLNKQLMPPFIEQFGPIFQAQIRCTERCRF